MSDNYKDKIKQQAIRKKKKNKLIKEGIEKLKEQGIDTTEMEERMLGYKLEDKEKPAKLSRQQITQQKYPTLPLTGNIIMGIYQIRNTQSNTIYIGKSQDIEKLWRSIICKLRNKTFGSYNLQSDYDMLGEDCFEFSILETIYDLDIPMDFYKYNHIFDLYKQGDKIYNPINQKDKILYKLLKTFINNNVKFNYQHKFEDDTSITFDFVVYKKNNVGIKEIIILRPTMFNKLSNEQQITKQEQHYPMQIDYCKAHGYKYSVVQYDDNGYSIIQYPVN